MGQCARTCGLFPFHPMVAPSCAGLHAPAHVCTETRFLTISAPPIGQRPIYQPPCRRQRAPHTPAFLALTTQAHRSRSYPQACLIRYRLHSSIFAVILPAAPTGLEIFSFLLFSPSTYSLHFRFYPCRGLYSSSLVSYSSICRPPTLHTSVPLLH
ncbi:hypothetical protein PUMCH_002424 [Australozyma saopauloensis]|uniref:Uncharacterized protein n=1 Tax=Australozyma saopauloensis TaxID=291208 RepID=A0AAX4H985_9ASCO|nr:hypothetical protein PUMCH_002424 [[Candida] saopauloensis]